MTAESAARKAMEHGLRQVDVFVKGPGSGREMAIRSLQSSGVQVVLITDTTPIPFNGCPTAEATAGLIRGAVISPGQSRDARAARHEARVTED